MKKIALSLFILAFSISSYAGKPGLEFNKDGEFKIVMLTDLHLNIDKPGEAEKTYARIDFIINAEKPDFIAVTGDVLYGNSSSLEFLQRLVDKFDAAGVPFAIEFGNHDREHGRDAVEMSRIITSSPFNCNQLTEGKVLADNRIQVRPTKNRKAAPLDVYMFDSHDYTKLGRNGDKSYSYLSFDQIAWYLAECRKSNAGAGVEHVPSVAFFHIPFPEFYDAWVDAQEHEHNGVTGIRGEYGGHPKVNSGMFAAMLESGNMTGVFCGHDHDSDYIVDYHGIALVYGRFSGDDTVYNHLAHGTRVIVFKEGEMGFRTYIHEDDGRIQHKSIFVNGAFVDKSFNI